MQWGILVISPSGLSVLLISCPLLLQLPSLYPAIQPSPHRVFSAGSKINLVWERSRGAGTGPSTCYDTVCTRCRSFVVRGKRVRVELWVIMQYSLCFGLTGLSICSLVRTSDRTWHDKPSPEVPAATLLWCLCFIPSDRWTLNIICFVQSLAPCLTQFLSVWHSGSLCSRSYRYLYVSTYLISVSQSGLLALGNNPAYYYCNV